MPAIAPALLHGVLMNVFCKIGQAIILQFVLYIILCVALRLS